MCHHRLLEAANLLTAAAAAAGHVPCPTSQVHLHEHAGLVYVDSDGGSVTAWLSPSGSPLGLQVKAAGGVCLDPALKVSHDRRHRGGGSWGVLRCSWWWLRWPWL